MKLKKQILSIIIVLLIVINCLPIAYAAKYNILTINGNIYDEITNVEYGWNGTIYRFNDEILNGVKEGDEVYLVADALTNDPLTVNSNANVTFFNFRLEGANAADYVAPNYWASLSIQKQIQIVPKQIKITPEHSYIYYGQSVPDKITKVANYEDQIINNEDININATFEIQKIDDIKVDDYQVSLQGQPYISGDDADNYSVILDPNAKFRILAYEPDEEATSNDSIDGNYVGVKNTNLYSPDKFYISSNNNINDGWGVSLNINLEETQNGKYTYYLRNQDSDDTEHYQAISEPKEYKYTSVQTEPEVTGIKIEKNNADKILNFLSFGVFSNDAVNVTVYVDGAAIPQDTIIFLGESQNYESKTVYADKAIFNEKKDKYTYKATFTLDINKDESVTKYLKAYAENSCGKGNIYPTEETKGEFIGTDTNVNKPLTIDKIDPVVKIKNIDGNYDYNNDGVKDSVKVEFSISDSDSGIEKVEYLWDDGFLLNEDDLKYQTEYLELNDYSSDKTDYYLVLPWELSKIVPFNQHTLYLRVTDNAGNVYSNEKEPAKDTVGSDMLPPNIESVEIRKPESDKSETDFKYFDFGTFYNNSVEIVIKANDNEEDSYHYTGVKTVNVHYKGSYKEAIKDAENNEYVLVVSPDTALNDMYITVEDNNGLTTEKLITDIANHGNIKSNDLIIEDDDPQIFLDDILIEGHKDDKDNVWFGNDDSNTKMYVTVDDKLGTVHSGIYSVTIKDNGEVKYSNSNFSYNTTEHTETFIIGELSEGKHNITVDVEDYSGNTKSDSITFFKDTNPPKKGSIATVSPTSIIIGEQQWFNKDEVITFRLRTSDDASGLGNISLKINDKVFNYNYQNIKYDDGDYYVEADTTGIDTDSKHKYTVTGTATDFANNTTILNPITVYKDFENPTIEKFTVQKKTDTLDKILNVLTFGVYSNDTLIFKVYTKDDEFDSGIDYATVKYNGLSMPKKMTDEGSGVFSVEIPVNNTVFESDIIVTAYDKFGKNSVFCPDITSEDGVDISNGKFVMIEKAMPSVTINLPDSDGVSRTDNEVWYNSNKEITLVVQDENSGINNIDLTVNGIDITKDKNGVALLKSSMTESSDSRNNDEHIYTFDTDYFTSICGLAEDGKYVITAKVRDNAGNISPCEKIYYIDKVSPSIDRIDFTPKSSNGIEGTSEFIEKLEYGYYFKTDFNVIVNVSDVDPSSGCYEVKYRLVPYQDGEKQAEVRGTEKIIDGKATINVSKDFKGQILVEAFDRVLNSSGEKTAKAYVVDNLAPNIKITKNVNTNYHDSNGNNLYVETNSFTVVITDTVSGINQIGYSQSAEQNPYDRKTINVDNAGHKLKDDLGDGWIVTGVDVNLVTQVTKTFTFSNDDNDVSLTFDATDNSQNKSEDVKSESFTIDKTAPVINVVFRDDDDTDMYYNQNRIADITVVERNFDENLIKASIVNTFGNVPTFSFEEKSKTEHTAVINFDEGDYTFDLTGTDLGNHTATIKFNGGNEKAFYVDKTKPVVTENFSEFSNSTKNIFNVDKTASISIVEHNFDPEFVNLRIERKEAGSQHSADGLEDVTNEVLGVAKWNSTGDIHTISFTFDRDAVYYVQITPEDLASNVADKHYTAIFEIDQTKPVVSMKNGSYVGKDNTEFLDVYPYERKDEPAPTVEFEDLNISYIEYELSVFVPEYLNSGNVVVVPIVSSGKIDGNKYTLPDFTTDGIYAVKLTAVDIAGNKSELNLNTYARMVNQDVLAYIMDSNIEEKTGLYSLEYENGEAISKKPSSFEDLKILVMTKKDTDTNIVLRDANGNEILTNATNTVDDSIYGIGINNYLLKADFFKDNFQNDTDIELNLTVENQGERIDLAKMHIDNIAPTCDIPNDLTSWHWFCGESNQTFTLSNISELVDESNCKIYDNGKSIPFVYSENDNTIMFTLSKGWHNVGIALDDMAGNTNNIQEIVNIHIGYFWLWIIIALSIIIIIVVVSIVVYSKKRKKRELENF